MINPVDRLSWQEMLGHPASAGHLVDTQVNTAYSKMAVLSDHIDEFKDLYDFVFRIKGWLKYYLQAYYGLKAIPESGLNNDTNGVGGDIDLINPITGDIETKEVWRIYIKNYDEMIKASENGLPIPTPIVRFANIYDPEHPSYLDLSYDENGNPTFSGTFNVNDPKSFIPLWYLNEQLDKVRIKSVDRSISTTTDSHGIANKRLVVNDVINFSDGHHINVSGAADVPFMTKGSKVNISGDVTGSGTVDDDGNIVVPTTVSHATNADHATKADYATKASSADRAANADSATNAGHATNADYATKAANADYATNANHANIADKLAGGAASAAGAAWADTVGDDITVTVPNSGKLIVQFSGNAQGMGGYFNNIGVYVDGVESARVNAGGNAGGGVGMALLKGLSPGNHTISVGVSAGSTNGVLFVQAVN